MIYFIKWNRLEEGSQRKAKKERNQSTLTDGFAIFIVSSLNFDVSRFSSIFFIQISKNYYYLSFILHIESDRFQFKSL